MGLPSSTVFDAATVPDTLIGVNEEAPRSRTAVLRPGRASAPEAVGRGARRAVQGTLRSGPGGDRDPARRPWRGVHLQPDRLPRAVAADRLPSPARLEGSGLGRDREQAGTFTFYRLVPEAMQQLAFA